MQSSDLPYSKFEKANLDPSSSLEQLIIKTDSATESHSKPLVRNNGHGAKLLHDSLLDSDTLVKQGCLDSNMNDKGTLAQLKRLYHDYGRPMTQVPRNWVHLHFLESNSADEFKKYRHLRTWVQAFFSNKPQEVDIPLNIEEIHCTNATAGSDTGGQNLVKSQLINCNILCPSFQFNKLRTLRLQKMDSLPQIFLPQSLQSLSITETNFSGTLHCPESLRCLSLLDCTVSEAGNILVNPSLNVLHLTKATVNVSEILKHARGLENIVFHSCNLTALDVDLSLTHLKSFTMIDCDYREGTVKFPLSLQTLYVHEKHGEKSNLWADLSMCNQLKKKTFAYRK